MFLSFDTALLTVWLFGLYGKDLFWFFTEKNKRNGGKIVVSSIIYKNSFGLQLPLYDVTVLSISFPERTETYWSEYVILVCYWPNLTTFSLWFILIRTCIFFTTWGQGEEGLFSFNTASLGQNTGYKMRTLKSTLKSQNFGFCFLLFLHALKNCHTL